MSKAGVVAWCSGVEVVVMGGFCATSVSREGDQRELARGGECWPCGEGGRERERWSEEWGGREIKKKLLRCCH